jgi:hypothetical protein
MEWRFVFKVPLNAFAVYADVIFEKNCFPLVPLMDNGTKTRRASTLFQKMIRLKVLSELSGSCSVVLSNKKEEGVFTMKLGPGLTFSWKRAIGLTWLKQKISRKTGIPLTRSGRQRKIGKMLGMK